jgi:AraC-like DNA-binding protein
MVTADDNVVGYESPSQFSREYRRMFGAPPRQDVAAIKVEPQPTSHSDFQRRRALAKS